MAKGDEKRRGSRSGCNLFRKTILVPNHLEIENARRDKDLIERRRAALQVIGATSVEEANDIMKGNFATMRLFLKVFRRNQS